jgi:hypothetical protein
VRPISDACPDFRVTHGVEVSREECRHIPSDDECAGDVPVMGVECDFQGSVLEFR